MTTSPTRYMGYYFKRSDILRTKDQNVFNAARPAGMNTLCYMNHNYPSKKQLQLLIETGIDRKYPMLVIFDEERVCSAHACVEENLK